MTLIEMITYRRVGHAQHDNQSYQPLDEIDEWAATNDPLGRYVATLLDSGWVSEADLDGARATVDDELAEAVEAAERSPLPEPEAALEDVTGDGPVPPPWFRHSPPDPSRA